MGHNRWEEHVRGSIKASQVLLNPLQGSDLPAVSVPTLRTGLLISLTVGSNLTTSLLQIVFQQTLISESLFRLVATTQM